MPKLREAVAGGAHERPPDAPPPGPRRQVHGEQLAVHVIVVRVIVARRRFVAAPAEGDEAHDIVGRGVDGDVDGGDEKPSACVGRGERPAPAVGSILGAQPVEVSIRHRPAVCLLPRLHVGETDRVSILFARRTDDERRGGGRVRGGHRHRP